MELSETIERLLKDLCNIYATCKELTYSSTGKNSRHSLLYTESNQPHAIKAKLRKLRIIDSEETILGLYQDGSEAYVHVPKQLRKKWDKKSRKMILVGYQCDSCNYRLYNPHWMRYGIQGRHRP